MQTFAMISFYAPVVIIIVAVVAVLFSFFWGPAATAMAFERDGPAVDSVLALARARAIAVSGANYCLSTAWITRCDLLGRPAYSYGARSVVGQHPSTVDFRADLGCSFPQALRRSGVREIKNANELVAGRRQPIFMYARILALLRYRCPIQVGEQPFG